MGINTKSHYGDNANKREKASFDARDEKIDTKLNKDSAANAYEQRNNIIDVADTEIAKTKDIFENERMGQMTLGARQKLDSLAEELCKPFKDVRNEGFEKINDTMRTAEEDSDTATLQEIKAINTEYSEKLKSMTDVVKNYISLMKQGGTNVESLDYEDIAKLWASDVQAVKHIADILTIKDPKLCKLFQQVLIGSEEVKDNFETLDKYFEKGNTTVSPWTVISFMNDNTKSAYTKHYLNKNNVDKGKFFEEGIKRGVYSTVEAEGYYPEMYKDNDEALARDTEAQLKSKDYSKFVENIKNYQTGIELNTKGGISDSLGPKGIFKTGVKMLAVTDLFANFLVNATADGGFSIWNGFAHGVGNIYGISSILALFGLKVTEKDLKMRELVTSKKDEEKNAEILGAKTIKKLAKKHSINNFLRTKIKGKDDDRGSRAIAEFVAINGSGDHQPHLTLENFRKWLETEKTVGNKLKYQDLTMKLEKNEKDKTSSKIKETEFRKLFLSYNSLGISGDEAARFDKNILQK